MRESEKTKEQLSTELLNVRKRLAELEAGSSGRALSGKLHQATEDMLSQIVHGIPIATFVIDRNHTITHWNKACENMTGIAAGEVIGTKDQWRAFYASPRPVMADIRIDSVSDSELTIYYGDKGRTSTLIEGAYEAEDFFADLGDSGKWLFFTAAPLKDSNGNITGAIETLQDITDRKQAELALRSEIANLEQELKERYHFQSIIGKSRKMQKVYNLLENLTDTDTTVLITGESGTGKDLVARALHYSSIRASSNLVTVNCSALSENLLESELFGHVKGAFTGAVKDRIGRFQLADGGTLLLDEIGDISARIQLKLLRVLQEKECERVGDSTPVKVNVRVLAATNRDLREKVRLGEFREDLYYRLKVIEIKLPPLRERREDIRLLTRHFFDVFKKTFKRNISGIADDVLRLFMQYRWPGNIRELEHAMEHAFILCKGTTIMPEHLPSEIPEYFETDRRVCSKEPHETPQKLLDALDTAGWNKARAARILGISRPTLYQLIKKYRLSPPKDKL